MLILALDTSQSASSVGLLRKSDESLIHRVTKSLERGHDQALLHQISEVMRPYVYRDISRIVVTVGPGSFTGVRIGLAAAQALAMAHGIEIIGISTLEAYAASITARVDTTLFWVCVDARHDKIFLQSFDGNGLALTRPSLVSIQEAAGIIETSGAHFGGSGAPLVQNILKSKRVNVEPVGPTSCPDIAAVALLGSKLSAQDHPATPLYLKEPDVT